MKTVLGIDPGFGRIGFGCVQIERGNVRTVGFGVVTSKGERFEDRLLQISRDIDTLIKDYKPDVLAIERLFFKYNATTAMRVAEARGVILLSAAKAGVRIVEIAPAAVKKALTGDGKADKRAMQFMVKTLLCLPRPPRPDDAADALAIAICAGV
jgi:crossover junction endodeoxyribonuclease RuvC